MIVKKQCHQIDEFTSFSGNTIKNVKVGWESYGTLNEDKSNVILITHYFTGSSHAAGRYHQKDEEPGYWDSIIGPNKAIDTRRFFVLSVDSLVNINAYDENIITTGPASIDPDTNQAYGMRFPVVTMRDFVNVQKSVLESLGIKGLYAVAGPSMGSMQAIEWASAYPTWVPRLISVIGSAEADGWTTLTLITQSALAPEFFNQVNTQLDHDAHISDPQNPMYDIRKAPPIVNWLMESAAEKSKKMDANHLLYLVRANQLFITGMQNNLEKGLSRIKAKTLFITANKDVLLMPYHAQKAVRIMQSQGKDVQLHDFDGDLGHLEGVSNIAAHSETIRSFLEQ